MLISEIFKPQNIKLPLESEDKDELFEEMVNFLVDIEHFDNRDEILNTLWIRERKMSTGISQHIAIPHAHLPSIKKTVGVLGISKQGIDYDSLDGKPVNVVMLILGDKGKPNEHLSILKNIAAMMKNPDFYPQLMECKTPQEVTETLIEFEEAVM
jgi:nitrogen PTS system EIIA component